MSEKQLPILDNDTLHLLEQDGCFRITPLEETVDLGDKSRFERMEISSSEKMAMSALAQQIPTAMIAGAMPHMYTVSFPDGVPHTLTALKQGGVGSMIKEPVTGRFRGTASLYDMSAQAALLGAFTAMSVVTGQFFLAQINDELDMINQKIDRILDFLYGDKKAELLSEISFVRYAYQNFRFIMQHEQQRVATIFSLQEAKKVAIKDI